MHIINKYILLPACLLLFTFAASAQDTVYFNSDWAPIGHKETASFMRMGMEQKTGYVVTDYYYPSMVPQMTGTFSDPAHEVENGHFVYYDSTGGKSSEGTFVNGAKEGNWKYYDRNGKLLDTYMYKKDQKQGDHFTYFEDGSKKRLDVYEAGALISGKCYTRDGKDTTYYTDEPLFFVERMPEFVGGMNALYSWLGKTINYPDSARENGIEGRVPVSFIVGTDGSIYGVELAGNKRVGWGLEEEAMRAIAAMPNWIPGEQLGAKVPVRFTIPITFKLEPAKKKKKMLDFTR